MQYPASQAPGRQQSPLTLQRCPDREQAHSTATQLWEQHWLSDVQSSLADVHGASPPVVPLELPLVGLTPVEPVLPLVTDPVPVVDPELELDPKPELELELEVELELEPVAERTLEMELVLEVEAPLELPLVAPTVVPGPPPVVLAASRAAQVLVGPQDSPAQQ
jgi:hypothetical protein